MREVPECLNRRYKVLDELINEISTVMPASVGGKSSGCCSNIDASTGSAATENGPGNNDVGIKLMCDFWKILEEDPECNLREEVQQRMCKDTCKGKCHKKPKQTRSTTSCCQPKPSPSSDLLEEPKLPSRCSGPKSPCATPAPGVTPAKPAEDESLQKVLGNIRTAASFEQKCSDRVGELEIVQKDLIKQISHLEEKAMKGSGLLKEADCMWSCMEGSYKQKLDEAKEHCQLMQGQLNEIEASLSKWKNVQKDLEAELKSVNKFSEETNVKIIQKENDIKVMKMEIEGYKKRIASNAKDLTTAKNSYTAKKEASDAKVQKIAKDIERFQKQFREESKKNEAKEKESNASVKEVREDLQKLCRCLLQKKIENEDLKAETEALVNEVDLLKKTCTTCKDRCGRREQNIMDESKRLDKEISKFKLRCVRCHKETSSADVTGFCVECPRCLLARECLNEGDHCRTDHAQNCICTRIKHKFLDNVFENMYTVLERQVGTCPGKELADCILDCLKRSRNGKLNEETRSILQQFILSTVKQNLNLTIVGGAVKTRCEMDQETYEQLMLCLKDVTVTIPEKEDKGTVPKKLPCTRWSHSSECNCPKGPKTCPCTKTAPKKSTSPSTCGPVQEEEREDPSVKFCPLPEPVSCSLDCGMLGVLGANSWRRPPCGGPTCTFSSNMRAAQCVLGPEALADVRSHPSKIRAHASNKRHTADVRSNPPNGRVRTSNVRSHPSDGRVLMPAVRTHKSDGRARMPDVRAHTVEGRVRMCDTCEFPLEEFACPAKDCAYPAKERTYPADEPAYPAEESAYPTEESVYPDEESTYPDEESAYPAEKHAYTSEGRLRSTGRENTADVRSPSPSTTVAPKKGTGSQAINGDKTVNSGRTETKEKRLNVRNNFNKGRRENCNKCRRDNFNKGRRDNFNKSKRANIQKKTKASQLNLSLPDSASVQAKLKPISSLQKAIMFSDQHQEKILEECTKNKLKQNESVEQFKIAFKNEKGQSNCEFTELTQTPSGKLAIKLDKQTIKIKEEESITDPYLYMSIKTTSSGHVSVDFDTKTERNNDNCRKVRVRKTPSGRRLLDINKNMIRKLKDTLSNKLPYVGLSKNFKLPTSPKKPVNNNNNKNESSNKVPKPQDFKILDFHIQNNKEGVMYTSFNNTATDRIITEINMPLNHNKKKELNAKCTCKQVRDTNLMLKDIKGNTITHALLKKKEKETPTCSCDKSNKSSVNISKQSPSRSVDNSNYRSEFQQLYKQGNIDVSVEIQVENGVVRKLPAVVTKTKSGTIAIYARDMSSIKELSFNGNECPMSLSKVVSGTYLVSCGNKQSFNATLVKSSSERMLLIPQSFQEQHRNGHGFKDVYEVNLCVVRNQLLELPAMLRPTTSNNYIVVLDKEFEKCYNQTVKEYFGDQFEGSVDLQITSSGNYLLEMYNKDESNFEEKKRNAWLVKTSSGNIKIIVRPEFQSIFQRELSISSNSSPQASAQVDNTLPASSRVFRRDKLKKSENLDNQASSGKLKVKLQDDLPLPFSQPSAILENNSSDEYAVLNKGSKKSLLNNLQSDSLTCDSEKPVILKRLDSGEVIIKLNSKDDTKSHYGTLKITPSGNFYVAVDDDVIKDLTESSAKNDGLSSTVGTRSKQAMQLIESVHKSVATICQSKLDVCISDPSTCGCAEMTFDSRDGSMQHLCPCRRGEASVNNENSKKIDSDPIPSTSWNETSLNDTGPSFESFDSQIRSHKNVFKSTEQCYYLLHQLCNDEFCYEHVIRPKEIIGFVANREQPCQVWDSLNYLPQQLPYFLREVCHQ